MAPTIFPPTTSGTPPSTGTAPSSASSRNPSPPAATPSWNTLVARLKRAAERAFAIATSTLPCCTSSIRSKYTSSPCVSTIAIAIVQLFFFASAIAAGAIFFAVSAVIDGPYIGCACAKASAGTPAAITRQIRNGAATRVIGGHYMPPAHASLSGMTHAILTTVADRPGMLSSLTKVLADHEANITYVDILGGAPTLGIYFEVTLPAGTALATVLDDLHTVGGVERADETPSFSRIYGKRIVVMGGGAQVGLVAMGAISEADRHNIRGERISIDTIPLVGEQELAGAVRAVVRLPRVQMLVLAGSLMGGDITEAVKEVQAKGLRVISLNQAGSVPDVADLVVSDPTQAGVMAVMAVAETAKFDLVRQLKRRY